MNKRYFIFEARNQGSELFTFSHNEELSQEEWMNLASEWLEKHRDADWNRDSLTMTEAPTVECLVPKQKINPKNYDSVEFMVRFTASVPKNTSQKEIEDAYIDVKLVDVGCTLKGAIFSEYETMEVQKI